MNSSFLCLSILALGIGVARSAPAQSWSDDSVAGLLHREDVQTELKLTAAQKKRWDEIDRVAKPKRTSTFEGDAVVIPDPDELERKNAERETKAWSILGPDQTVRLHQLFVQRNGVRVFLRPEIQAQFEFTTEQTDQVRQAKARYVFSIHELLREIAKRNTDLSRADPKKVNDLRATFETRLTEDLDKIPTQDQRNRLVELGGKKFVFLERVFK